MGSWVMKIRVRRDLTSGIALMIISAILWFMIPYHIVVPESGNSAQMFPRMIIGFMFLVACYISGKSVITKRDIVLEFDGKKEVRIILYALALILYVFLIDKVGYLVATLGISALTLAVFKARKKFYVAMGVFVVVVYMLFIFGLGVPLP